MWCTHMWPQLHSMTRWCPQGVLHVDHEELGARVQGMLADVRRIRLHLWTLTKCVGFMFCSLFHFRTSGWVLDVGDTCRCLPSWRHTEAPHKGRIIWSVYVSIYTYVYVHICIYGFKTVLLFMKKLTQWHLALENEITQNHSQSRHAWFRYEWISRGPPTPFSSPFLSPSEPQQSPGSCLLWQSSDSERKVKRL